MPSRTLVLDDAPLWLHAVRPFLASATASDGPARDEPRALGVIDNLRPELIEFGNKL